MKRVRSGPVAAAAALLGVLWAAPMHAAPARAETIVLRNATLIDGTGRTARPVASIVVRDGWIESIADRAGPLPRGARIIDGAGRFVIPALWDMHVHGFYDALVRNVYFPLDVANGVLGVRDMFGDCGTDSCDGYSIATVRAWQNDIAAGTLTGPAIVAGSALIDGRTPWWPGSLAVPDAAAARAAVRLEKGRGVDFIKIYNGLTRDAFFAVADESRRNGLSYAGHVPYAIDAIEAADAGMASVEHLTGFALSASSQRDRYRAELVAAALGGAPAIGRVNAAQDLPGTFDAARAAAIVEAFRRNHTVQVPTIVVAAAHAREGDPATVRDERNAYLPRGLIASWRASARPGAAGQTYRDAQTARVRFAHRVVADMERAGVPILAGTDLGNPWVYPGFSLHDELGELVASGLTPLRALQSATRDAAAFVGDRDGGTLEPGKRADLVVLEADPLADIANTRRIAGVMQRGRWRDRSALDALLARARAFAARYDPRPAPWDP